MTTTLSPLLDPDDLPSYLDEFKNVCGWVQSATATKFTTPTNTYADSSAELDTSPNYSQTDNNYQNYLTTVVSLFTENKINDVTTTSPNNIGGNINTNIYMTASWPTNDYYSPPQGQQQITTHQYVDTSYEIKNTPMREQQTPYNPLTGGNVLGGIVSSTDATTNIYPSRPDSENRGPNQDQIFPPPMPPGGFSQGNASPLPSAGYLRPGVFRPGSGRAPYGRRPWGGGRFRPRRPNFNRWRHGRRFGHRRPGRSIMEFLSSYGQRFQEYYGSTIAPYFYPNQLGRDNNNNNDATTPQIQNYDLIEAGMIQSSTIPNELEMNTKIPDRGIWPWHASIRYQGTHVCSGFLITDKHVVSAASCYTGMNIYDLTVHLGTIFKSGTDTNEQSRNVIKLYKHIFYGKIKKHDSDIALIHMETAVKLNSFVNPICLPQVKPTPDLECKITNFGVRNDTSNIYMNEMDATVLTNKICNKPEKLNEKVTDNMICATSGDEQSCLGESGGPLQCRDDANNQWHAYGIASWGSECTDLEKPGVFTRLNLFRKWIKDKIK